MKHASFGIGRHFRIRTFRELFDLSQFVLTTYDSGQLNGASDQLRQGRLHPQPNDVTSALLKTRNRGGQIPDDFSQMIDSDVTRRLVSSLTPSEGRAMRTALHKPKPNVISGVAAQPQNLVCDRLIHGA
jgi:hypothetical protein